MFKEICNAKNKHNSVYIIYRPTNIALIWIIYDVLVLHSTIVAARDKSQRVLFSITEKLYILTKPKELWKHLPSLNSKAVIISVNCFQAIN